MVLLPAESEPVAREKENDDDDDDDETVGVIITSLQSSVPARISLLSFSRQT